MNISLSIVLLYCVTILLGCSGQQFSGEGAVDKPKTEVTESDSTQDEEQETFSKEDDTGLGANTGSEENEVDEDEPELSLDDVETVLSEDGFSDDDQIIMDCMAEWGTTDLSKSAVKGYKTLTASGTGFSGSSIQDMKKTDEPRLVLVKANSVGFSGAQIELMNPMGRYCISVENTGFSSSKAYIHCEADVAGMSTKNVGFSGSKVDYVGC